MKENIFAIKDGKKHIGHGFLANGYFISAAHVLRDNPNSFVKLKEEKKEFSKTKPLYVGRGKDTDPSFIDLVILKFENVEGGFPVLDYTPQKDEVLESCCIRKVNGNEEYELDVEPAWALGESEGNYFYCKCNRDEGSSGSPLIKDNHVIGIMHGGEFVKKLIEKGELSEEEKLSLNLKDEDKICAFLKISAFISLIENINQ
ncbi:MAG: trypsin-like peptidase domain-containing protein [Prevotella sp.]|nr:trypsin-like peptidase domain-containing protein [Prevotella sp.]